MKLLVVGQVTSYWTVPDPTQLCTTLAPPGAL
ncbi:hypothetical protein JOF36_000200 [Pseudonocardia parietis]|uniref:Uncharacterized protein n=1 Tax=Pseudonocardia parietis TaxID=570936 RepID=A0ABS4VKQ8_9PSEU|nr:hypothetical protein [Pseudonocardia parietis]